MNKRNSLGSNYQIANLNDKSTTVLTLLHYTDKNNFETRRKEMIYAALNISHPHDKKRAIKECLEKIVIEADLHADYKHKNHKKKSKPLTVKKVTDLVNKLNENKLTPYEVIGKLKDDLKGRFSTPLMKKYWVQLSVIDGIASLGDKSTPIVTPEVEINWEKKIYNNSTIPKLSNLAESLEKNPKGKRYFENFPHIKNSSGKNTNWEEIICSTDPQNGALIRNLLSCQKNDIKKDEITKQYLWPRQLDAEIENRRLNSFLKVLGNRPTGRNKRYEKMLLNIEDELKVKDLPEVPISLATKKEEKEVIELLESLEPLIAQGKTKKGYPKYKSNWKRQILDTEKLREANKLKKINSPIAQTLFGQWEKLVKPLLHLNYNDTIEKIREGLSINQEYLLKLILAHKDSKLKSSHLLITAIENIDKISKKILSSDLKDRVDFNLAIKQEITSTSTSKKLSKEPKEPKEPRVYSLINALINKTPYDLKKAYGDEVKLTPIYITTLAGTNEELKVLCQECVKQGISLSPKTMEFGNTPLHNSNPEKTKILLSFGADPFAKNNERKTPLLSNPYQDSIKIMESFAVKGLVKKEKEEHGEISI